MNANWQHARELPPGLIFDIARDADLALHWVGDKKATLRCPFHDDRTPSAFLSINNIFHCSVCTPGSKLLAKEFAERLRVEWRSCRFDPASRPRAHDVGPGFTAEDASRVWDAAHRRAFDERHPRDDRAVYAFLHTRGLERAWNDQQFGILGAGMALPNELPTWVDRGYRLVAPLYDQHGSLINIQARNVFGNKPKTMFPKGSRAKGTVFANRAGLALLHGAKPLASRIVFGEGLTDFLALSSVPEIAVLSAPGVSVAESAIGSWARGHDVVLALDTDPAGENVRVPVARAALRNGATHVAWIEWPHPYKDACDVIAQCGADGLDLFFAQHLTEVRCG